MRAQGIGSSFLTVTLADKQKARKIKHFLRLLNEEKKRLGLGPYPVWKELENEKQSSDLISNIFDNSKLEF